MRGCPACYVFNARSIHTYTTGTRARLQYSGSQDTVSLPLPHCSMSSPYFRQGALAVYQDHSSMYSKGSGAGGSSSSLGGAAVAGISTCENGISALALACTNRCNSSEPTTLHTLTSSASVPGCRSRSITTPNSFFDTGSYLHTADTDTTWTTSLGWSARCSQRKIQGMRITRANGFTVDTCTRVGWPQISFALPARVLGSPAL